MRRFHSVERSRLFLFLFVSCVWTIGGCPDDENPGDPGTPGITVTPTDGLRTTERGGQAMFAVVLDSQPSADVTIPLSSSDATEGTVSPAVFIFTPDDWDAPRVATITGVDDMDADGDQTYTIFVQGAASADSNYAGIDGDDVVVVNTDDETAGITVEPTAGLMTTEAGGSDTFTVVLNAPPSADVTVGLTTSDETEGTVTPASFVFTVDNWSAPQTAIVTGVDDDLVDPDTTYMIVTGPAMSDDSEYAGRDAADVEVTNLDDETARVVVDPVDGLATSEAGGTDTFSVVLNTAPAADVTIALTIDDDTEGTVSPPSVTFTPDNWNAPQVVTVTGVDDELADGDQVYMVETAAAMSADGVFDGLDAEDVAVINVDDDSVGITVDPLDGLVTREDGSTAAFTVVLNTQPTAEVVVDLESSDTGEGTVGPGSLTFTVDNWNAPQTVTVTGVDDLTADGDQPYSVRTLAAASADAGYNEFDAPDVAVTNVDDDSAGVTVDPTSDLTTGENGDTATFTIVLNSAPTADVRFDLASSDPGEGTVSPTSTTFTVDNWDAPQTVTITGQDDALADGNQPYTITTSAAISADVDYSGIDPDDVSVSNVDDDSAGVTVDPVDGLETNESGTEATFTIVLNAEPTADVTFPIASSDTTEGQVDVTDVIFTTANWNAPVTVTVTGQDDDVADGDQPLAILIGIATSADPDYGGVIDPPNVDVTNVDNDSAGVTVEPESGLITTEAGGTDTFTVVLNSQPTADVVIDLASDDLSEGTAAPATLTFTTDNWNAPQLVTVTGVGDVVFDGDQPYQIVLDPATSGDPDYDGLDPADVSVVNDDNDPGVRVTPTSGLTTTEAGGTATFTVVLNTAPSANVMLSITSDNTGEGTASPSSLVFTPANFGSPQTVTVTGVDDAEADGDQPYSIVTGNTVSTDLSYNALIVDDVDVTNEDDETAGFVIAPFRFFEVTEAGSSAEFTLRLRSQPTASVTVGIRSVDTTEATASPASLVFTTANWDAPQTVTITGVDDLIADGNQVFVIITDPATSADTNYDGLNPTNVPVRTIDDETAGFLVSPLSVVTREDGTLSPQFGVRLTSEPTADVTIAVSSSDTGEGTPSPATLTFTSTNWNGIQNVTVTGVEDALADGDQPYEITLAPATSADATYDGLDPANVSATNVDNDSAGITVTAAPGLQTTEAGGTATFTIQLNSQPTFTVTIGLSSSDTTEGTPSPTSLGFTASNWNAPQTVTVTGVNDFVADGDQVYTIVTAPAVSSDGDYAGLDAVDVSLTNIDNETAGFTVDPTAGLVVNESGTTATFDVELNSQPTANVTIPLSVSDPGEGSVSPLSLTFTALNWDAPQTVTVTGVNDFVADGAQAFTVVTELASSADVGYDGLNPADVSATTIDDDSAGVTVDADPGLETTEEGGTATFTVRLNSQPTADVSITLTSDNTGEGTVSAPSLTFTSLNWDAPQVVTVTGVDDAVADGNQPYSIVTGAASSTDGGYSGLVVDDVSLTNVDDETAGIQVSQTSGLLTNEAGTATATFTVRLTSEPTATVTIPVAVDDTTEASVAAALSFDDTDWFVPQIVTVTGVDDAVADGNQSFVVSVGPAMSGDASYSGLSGPSVSGTNLDDETAGISVTPTTGLITTEAGGTDTFDVELNSEPVADVTITLTIDTSEGTLSSATLTFDDTDWNVPQTVTVTGVDDAIPDGNQLHIIVGDSSTSLDTDYAALSPFTVQVTNTDDDGGAT